MRRAAVLLGLALAMACGTDGSAGGAFRAEPVPRAVPIEYGHHELRDVLAAADGAWLVGGGPVSRIDRRGRVVVRADPSTSGDPAMAGIDAAVETPEGLFGVLGGCDCHDGRTIAGWLVRFDANDGSLDAYRLLDRDSPFAIEHGAAGLWSVGGGVLRRIDPATLDDVLLVDVEATVASLAVGDDEVYVGDAHTSTVQRVDAVTGEITASFRGAGAIIGAQSIAVGANVWTIEEGGVVELDATSLEEIRRIPIATMRSGELDADGDVVWIYTEAGLYSLADGAARATERLTVTGRHIGSIDARGDALWLTDYLGGRLYRVDVPPTR